MSSIPYVEEKIETARQLGDKNLTERGKGLKILVHALELQMDLLEDKILKTESEEEVRKLQEELEARSQEISDKVTPWAEKVNAACWKAADPHKPIGDNVGFKVTTV